MMRVGDRIYHWHLKINAATHLPISFPVFVVTLSGINTCLQMCFLSQAPSSSQEVYSQFVLNLNRCWAQKLKYLRLPQKSVTENSLFAILLSHVNSIFVLDILGHERWIKEVSEVYPRLGRTDSSTPLQGSAFMLHICSPGSVIQLHTPDDCMSLQLSLKDLCS